MLTKLYRELDAKAEIQRKREEEAERKLAEKRRGLTSRVPDRTAPIRPTEPVRAAEAVRTESNERPSGPPRLALAGNKPTWRERQAAKESEGATSTPPPTAPQTDIATEEAALPKRTGGYVPPARRGGDAAPRGRTDAAPSAARDESTASSAEPTAKWRPGAPRDGLGRDGSPADGPRPRFLDGLRPAGNRDRDGSPADGAGPGGRPVSSSGAARTESPVDGKPAPTPGKYVPVHLRNKG